jgi:Flp pilus assembly pilin Flp
MRRSQQAQNVVEYGLLIVTIVLVIVLAVPTFGNDILAWLHALATRITTA